MSLRPHLHFVDVRQHGGFSTHVALPPGLASGEQDGYTIGYRHMCDFMAFRWFDALSEYEYAMRIDEVFLKLVALRAPAGERGWK